ncbi:MAG: hypothetical protein ACRBHB_20730 [Arenicella sp.]
MTIKKSNSSLCSVVGSGGVGESGNSRLLHHKVTGPISKLMVVRTTQSNLCPNTGAIAVLTVNGTPVSSGVISDRGGSIQAEAEPGDSVCAIVATVPLFNDIQCIMLGELSFDFEECDFE